MVGETTALQAHFLARLDVVQNYEDPEHGAGNQGFFVWVPFDAPWRSSQEILDWR